VNNESNRVLAYLSFFNESQIAEIITAVRSHGTSLISHATEFRKDTGNIASLAIMNRDVVSSAEDTQNLAMGVSLIIFHATRLSWSENAYEAIFEDVFGISSEYAQKLALQIDTDDVVHGAFSHVVEWFKDAWNFIVPDFLDSLEMEADPQFDVDFLYEWLQLGAIARQLVKRAKLATAASYLAINEAHKIASESGDPLVLNDFLAESTKFLRPTGYTHAELGGIFDWIKKAGKSVGNVLGKVAGGPLGQVLGGVIGGPAGAALMTGVGSLLNSGGGQQAPPPDPGPQTAPVQGSGMRPGSPPAPPNYQSSGGSSQSQGIPTMSNSGNLDFYEAEV